MLVAEGTVRMGSQRDAQVEKRRVTFDLRLSQQRCSPSCGLEGAGGQTVPSRPRSIPRSHRFRRPQATTRAAARPISGKPLKQQVFLAAISRANSLRYGRLIEEVSREQVGSVRAIASGHILSQKCSRGYVVEVGMITLLDLPVTSEKNT